MAMTAAELIKADQDHLIHPLHHPIDNAEPPIYVRGRGAMVEDIGGHQMIAASGTEVVLGLEVLSPAEAGGTPAGLG